MYAHYNYLIPSVMPLPRIYSLPPPPSNSAAVQEVANNAADGGGIATVASAFDAIG